MWTNRGRQRSMALGRFRPKAEPLEVRAVPSVAMPDLGLNLLTTAEPVRTGVEATEPEPSRLAPVPADVIEAEPALESAPRPVVSTPTIVDDPVDPGAGRSVPQVVLGPEDVNGPEDSSQAGRRPPMTPGDFTDLPSERSRPFWVQMYQNWRIVARSLLPTEIEGPKPGSFAFETDQFHQSPESAQSMPIAERLSLIGRIAAEEGIDFYQLPMQDNSRAVRVVYRVLRTAKGQDRDEAGPFRVWLMNNSGQVLDAWHLKPPYRAIEMNIRALGRAEPTTLFLGIEATGTSSEPTTYALDVQRPSLVSSIPDPFVTDPGFRPEPGADEAQRPGQTAVPPSELEIERGLISTPASLEGSTSGRDTFEATGFGFEALAESATNLGFGRPLPTQAAATSGGFLPTGPSVKSLTFGQEPSQRLRPIPEALMPPLITAEDATEPGRASEPDPDNRTAENEKDSATNAEGFTASVDVLAAVEPGWPDSRIDPQSRLPEVITEIRGPGGVPLAAASIRWGWPNHRQPMFSPVGEVPLAPPNLIATPVSIANSGSEQRSQTAEGKGQTADSKPKGEPDEADRNTESTLLADLNNPEQPAPTRPQVFRSALVVAALLGFGLLLPDLQADRSLLRPLWPFRGLRRWRWRVARQSRRSSDPR